MTQPDLPLAADFPDATPEQWRELAEKSLRGIPFDKLLTRTYEGFPIRPLYTIEDWPPAGDPSGLPGFSPYTRGARAAGPVAAGWAVCQLHAHPDLKAANTQILRDLERGATALGLQLDRAARAGLSADSPGAEGLAGADGLMIYSAADLDAALEGVLLDLAPVSLYAGAQFLPAAALFIAVARRRGIQPAQLQAAFNADPLAALAAEGRLPVSLDAALDQMAALAIWTRDNLPNCTAVAVDTTVYHSAGATEAEDLAASMATAVAYLRSLTDAGLEIDDACRQIVFRYAVDADFFMSIAKLRAARRLWSRIAQACGASPEAAAMRQHALTAPRMMTHRDPWVNMLRTTIAGFAAGVAGADSLTVLPYDAALGVPTEFGRRIARNTQVILQEESSLNRVIDPAGGAWYLESLTEELAETAWKLFQEIEAGGGMAEALLRGRVQEGIAASRSARALNIARRKDPITGVSEFPHLHEKAVEADQPDLGKLREEAIARLKESRHPSPDLGGLSGAELVDALTEAAGRGATLAALASALRDAAPAAAEPSVEPSVEPLPSWRLAEEFEALRDASDAALAADGFRPRIFLANLGPIAKHTARASYAKNFFEAGGIEAVTNDGFKDPESAMRAFADSTARVAILCGSNDQYEELVAEFAPALKTAGAQRLYLAGGPGEREAEFRAAGVDGFIYLGCDVLATLRDLHEFLEVGASETAASGATE